MRVHIGAATVLFSVLAATARAQTWELDAYGGVVVERVTGSERVTLPAVGPAVITSSPIFPSRAVPSSWMFGDGATLLNNVNIEFAVPGRITPLDTILAPGGAGSRAAFGVRLRRAFNDRWAVEIGLDMFPAGSVRSPELEAAVEATRASFENAFADLLATGPFTSVAIEATATTAGGASRDIAATGAAVWSFGPRRSFVPYVALGGGIIRGLGGGSSASLTGEYSFSILGQVPIREIDRVTVRYTGATTPVGVAGGGVRRNLSDRWGLRIDARMLIGRDTARVLLDASPNVVAGAPAGFIESFTSPSIQFSNNASTGRVSTLSGAALQGFEAFAGGGLRLRTLVTVAVTRRF